MVSSETFYRQTAGEGATYIGLLLVVYDTLAGDLRRAGEAVDRGDIAARCHATNHALLLLGHLESWAESLAEVELRTSLSHFYAYLRVQAIALQAAGRKDGFNELAGLVEETRAVWQRKEASGAVTASQIGGVARAFAAEEQESSARGSWSA